MLFWHFYGIIHGLLWNFVALLVIQECLEQCLKRVHKNVRMQRASLAFEDHYLPVSVPFVVGACRLTVDRFSLHEITIVLQIHKFYQFS